MNGGVFYVTFILNLSINGNQIILTVNLGAMSGKIEKSYFIALQFIAKSVNSLWHLPPAGIGYKVNFEPQSSQGITYAGGIIYRII